MIFNTFIFQIFLGKPRIEYYSQLFDQIFNFGTQKYAARKILKFVGCISKFVYQSFWRARLENLHWSSCVQ